MRWLDYFRSVENENQNIAASLGRSIRTLCVVLIFVFSLLSFPSVTPWIAAFWIGWSIGRIAWQKPGWLPLAACLATLLFRPVAFTPAMTMLVVTLLLSTLWLYRHQKKPNPVHRRLICCAMAFVWIAMLLEWRVIEKCSATHTFDFSRPIVCLGDSLTEGLHPDGGYPDALKRLVKPKVINLGFSGIASSQAVGQIDRVLSHNPQLVIIELGGHDFLKGHSRSETHRNLTSIIHSCKQKGSDVILMEIPRGFIFDPYASLERQIAYEEDVQIISDTWLRQIVLRSPIAPPGRWMSKQTHLSNDGIHSNRRGSEKIAHDVARVLGSLYGKAALLHTEG